MGRSTSSMHTEANAAGLMATKALSFAESQQSTKPAGVDAITKEFSHHQQWRKHFLTQLRKRKSLKDGTASNNQPKETTMKTPDYETIAYMFVHAAEALFMMAAREKVGSIKPPKKIKSVTAERRKGGGRPKGAKNWTRAEEDNVLKMHDDLHSITDIAKAIGRNNQSIRSKLFKLNSARAAQ